MAAVHAQLGLSWHIGCSTCQCFWHLKKKSACTATASLAHALASSRPLPCARRARRAPAAGDHAHRPSAAAQDTPGGVGPGEQSAAVGADGAVRVNAAGPAAARALVASPAGERPSCADRGAVAGRGRRKRYKSKRRVVTVRGTYGTAACTRAPSSDL